MKTCVRCFSSSNSFYKDHRASDGLFSACIECYRKDYQKNKSKRLSQGRQWKKANKKRIYEVEKIRRSRPEVKARNNARQKMREALKQSPLSKFFSKEIQEFYIHAKDCELVSGEKYHVDHIVPLQGKDICGLHVPWNLQVLPADINIRKGNK